MNLLKSLTDQFGGQIIKGLAGNLGIGENEARSSMNGVLPSLLGSLINKAGTNSGADELFDLVKKDDYSGGMLDNLGSLFGGGTNSSLLKTGAGLLPMLLGGSNKMSGVLDIAGRLFGGGAGRQRSILSMLAPLVISFIGKKLHGSNNLNKPGLLDLLKGQRAYVKDAVHPEMASALGFADWKEDEKEARRTEPAHTGHHEEPSGSGLGLLKWLLPLLLFGLIGLFLMRSCGGEKEVKQVPDKKPAKVETQQKPIQQSTKQTTKPPMQQSTKQTTKPPVQQNSNTTTKPTQSKPANTNTQQGKAAAATNNGTQNTTKPATSTATYTGEAKLFQDAAKAGSSTVVNFGSLSPDGKALSTPAKTRLDQIADIMKATPGLNIEVRGHNKDQGNKVKNTSARAASKIRAGLVQAYLVTKGIKANRIKSVSVGHNEPLGGIAATDDKQKRITIKTVKK